MDDVHFQNHVVVHEIGKGVLVCHDAAHLGGGEEDILRLFFGKKCLHLILPGQIQFLVGSGDNIVVALPVQFPDNGTAHHAPVARHINFRILLHHCALTSFMVFSRIASCRSCTAIIRTSSS